MKISRKKLRSPFVFRLLQVFPLLHRRFTAIKRSFPRAFRLQNHIYALKELLNFSSGKIMAVSCLNHFMQESKTPYFDAYVPL